MTRKMESFGSEGKPEKRKRRASQDRFAFHQCFHGDAWQGLLDLDDGEVGVYWRIILLMYIRRAAIPLDFAWLAGQCNITHQRCRARVEALEAKGRIKVDREAAIIFDERAMRELVAAERFNAAQQERSKIAGAKRAKAKPELRIVAGETLISIRETLALAENVSGANKAEVAERSGERGGERGGERPPSFSGYARLSGTPDQELSVSREPPNHIHIHNNPLTPSENDNERAPDGGPPMPSLRAGGPPPNEARKRRLEALAALDLLKGGGAEPAQGIEGEQSETDEPDHPADRKARRD